eukprot:6360186-Amphidinium_carterae.1
MLKLWKAKDQIGRDANYYRKRLQKRNQLVCTSILFGIRPNSEELTRSDMKHGTRPRASKYL